jgi:hypothetical protein
MPLDLVAIDQTGSLKTCLSPEMPPVAPAIFSLNEQAWIAPTYFSFVVEENLRRGFAC